MLITIIKIIDEPMGRGKTNAAIKYLKIHGQNDKIVYATPFLNEIQRILSKCSFCQEPKLVSSDGKKGSFLWLAEREHTIATTHALLADRLGRTDLTKFKEFNYKTLILDETLQAFDCSEENLTDLKAIVAAGHIEINNDGLLTFNNYDGNLLRKNSQLNNKNVYLAADLNNYKSKSIPLITSLLPELWDCFEEVLILTYRFVHSDLRIYFDINNMTYEYWHLEEGQFVEGQRSETFKIPPINIYEGKLNDVGNHKNALSLSWYKKNITKLSILKNNTNNYIRNIKKAKNNNACWTTFADYEKKIKGKGYTKGFLACNARATNVFQDRNVVAYLINRFLNPLIKQFFIGKEINFDEDQMMLNEMLQFLFRTAVRKNEPISLYCPSLRMRTLLKAFIEENKTLEGDTRSNVALTSSDISLPQILINQNSRRFTHEIIKHTH